MKVHKWAALAATGMVLTALTACGSGEESGSSDDVTVALTAPVWTVEAAQYAVAEELGFYADEDLQVTFNLAPSGTQAVQQVLGGNADVAVATPEPLAIAAAKGQQLRFFLPDYGEFIYQLAAVDGAGISSVEDLRGKRIGITNANSTGLTFAKTALKRAGLSEDDVTFVPIGVGPQQISAIQRGQVDALAMWDTMYVTLQTQGVDTTKIEVDGLDGLLGGGAMASVDALDGDDGDKLIRFGRATAKALVFAASNPEEATEILWKVHPETAPQPDADRAAIRKAQATILSARMKVLVPDPTSVDFLTFSDEAADKYAAWAEGAGLVPETLRADQLIDNDLVPEISDFDVADAAATRE